MMRSKRLNEEAAERALRSCAGLGIAFEGMERFKRLLAVECNSLGKKCICVGSDAGDWSPS